MGANSQTSVPLYAAGEILTAANMNISAGTGVPVFATTTTRDAAFGGTGEKTLAEGQMCYIEAAPKRFQVYNGTEWVDYFAEWTTWTPTYSNVTVGNGTVTARYVQLGKFVYCWWRLVLGSTSAIGTGPLISMPVTAAGVTTQPAQCGMATFKDTGTDNTYGFVAFENTLNVYIFALNVAGTYPKLTNVTATVPFTWTTTDELIATWTYEAA